jgi:hypothetical protein
MPSNISTYNADNSAATFTALTGASGTAPAVYRNLAKGSTNGAHPELRAGSRSNGTNTGRTMTIEFSYPSLSHSTDTGLDTVIGRINYKLTVAIPNSATAVDVQNAAANFTNALSGPSLGASGALGNGFAPT